MVDGKYDLWSSRLHEINNIQLMIYFYQPGSIFDNLRCLVFICNVRSMSYTAANISQVSISYFTQKPIAWLQDDYKIYDGKPGFKQLNYLHSQQTTINGPLLYIFILESILQSLNCLMVMKQFEIHNNVFVLIWHINFAWYWLCLIEMRYLNVVSALFVNKISNTFDIVYLLSSVLFCLRCNYDIY